MAIKRLHFQLSKYHLRGRITELRKYCFQTKCLEFSKIKLLHSLHVKKWLLINESRNSSLHQKHDKYFILTLGVASLIKAL